MLSWFGKQKAKPVAIQEILQRVSRRAERLTPKEQAESFVSVGGLESKLLNRDSRVIFGRRGTGKTHILSYVFERAVDEGDIPLLIDLRKIGSNNSIYHDSSIRKSHRAQRLLRDFVEFLAEALVDHYTDPKFSRGDNKIHEYITALTNSIREITITERVTETSYLGSEGESVSRLAGTTELSFVKARVGGAAESSNSKLEKQGTSLVAEGTRTLSINLGAIGRALSDVSCLSEARIWILLDEWSSVPIDLQPYLADLILRCFLPIDKITVQIAAIEFRSRFREETPNEKIGLELGADVFADINLDDFFVFENNPEISVEFFSELLFKHLKAHSKIGELNAASKSEVVRQLFTQEPAFRELVKACEGVPRDFLNIAQLAASRSNGTISITDVRTASKDWFERDKEKNIEQNEESVALLHWIRDFVINKRKVRAFLVETPVKDRLIEFLFDERLLHVAKRSYSSKDDPGVRYRVYKVDYGCYVDLMTTKNAPTGYLFPEFEVEAGEEIAVPEDDYRALRRAILNLSQFYKNVD